MIVRGDHTSVNFFLAVIPTGTECIVFSIDGSFTASMSVSGKDPKVRAGAVDVVRYAVYFFLHNSAIDNFVNLHKFKLNNIYY